MTSADKIIGLFLFKSRIAFFFDKCGWDSESYCFLKTLMMCLFARNENGNFGIEIIDMFTYKFEA